MFFGFSVGLSIFLSTVCQSLGHVCPFLSLSTKVVLEKSRFIVVVVCVDESEIHLTLNIELPL